MSPHDRSHLDALGGVQWIIVTNSDHIRDAQALVEHTGAGVMGPRKESATFPLHCQRWLANEVEVESGLLSLELDGSKTPGELALVLDETTLITGDLIRCHQAGSLTMLPDDKLANKRQAVESVRWLSFLPLVETVLVGDGWPLFSGGKQALEELVASQENERAGR